MPLSLVIPVFGPPAAGKTTLTMELGRASGRTVFRLREHVPRQSLVTTASRAERLDWIDDPTVMRAVRNYLESLTRTDAVNTLFLDNFPGTGTQVGMLLAVLRQSAPETLIRAIELVASPAVLNQRALNRRVCHHCERDPIRDPRLPAEASREDPQRCAVCRHILHPRPTDAPQLLKARMQRYQEAAEGIRRAFRMAGVSVHQFDSSCSHETIRDAVATLLSTRSSSP